MENIKRKFRRNHFEITKRSTVLIFMREEIEATCKRLYKRTNVFSTTVARF